MQFLKNIKNVEAFKLVLDNLYNTTGNFDKVGQIIEAEIVKIDNERGFVVVDSNLKSESIIPLSEFKESDKENLVVGNKIKCYLVSLDRKGSVLLSRSEAVKFELKKTIRSAMESDIEISGTVLSAVKNGFLVDLDGLQGFVSNSQLDLKDSTLSLIGKKLKFKVLNLKGDLAILSRKSIIDLETVEKVNNFFDKVQVGDILEGTVRHITDTAAFVSFDSDIIDAMLHILDISWNKISHPTDVLKVGDHVKVQVVKIDKSKYKISVSMKHLQENPWLNLVKDYKVNDVIEGTVSQIAEYGLFLKFGDVEGLIHISEFSWTKTALKMLNKINIGDHLKAQIIGIDPDKQKISLSLKSLTPNPWKDFSETKKEGDLVDCDVSRIVDYGIFVSVGELESLIHLNDISWSSVDPLDLPKMYKIGDKIQAVYLGFDDKINRIKLSIKDITSNPFEKYKDVLVLDSNVTCKVISVKPDRLDVSILDGSIVSSIKKTNLSRDRQEQRVDRFVPGDKLDARIIGFQDDNGKKIPILSVKAYEDAEIKMYTKSESGGASIADILGLALKDSDSK